MANTAAIKGDLTEQHGPVLRFNIPLIMDALRNF